MGEPEDSTGNEGMKVEIKIWEWGNDGMGKELMGENGKQKAAPWHDLVIDVDICCSLLDQSSDAMPSSPTQAT